jgi:hypothetical protein
VVDPIRERVCRAGWVGELSDIHAVYFGPSNLLVNLWITPAPAESDGSAGELLKHVERLRDDLLGDPAIAQVTITLVSADH